MMQRRVQCSSPTGWCLCAFIAASMDPLAADGGHVPLGGMIRAAPPEAPNPEEPKFTHGVLIRFHGPVTRGLEHYLYRKMDAAQKTGPIWW